MAALRTLNSPINGMSNVSSPSLNCDPSAEYFTSRIRCAQFFREPDFDHLRETILRDFHAIGIVAVQQDHAVLRNDVEQTPEAQLDLIEIFKNVGVIELDVVYDQQVPGGSE